MMGLVQSKKQCKRAQIVCSRTTRARGEKSGVPMGVYKKLHLAHIRKILDISVEYSYQNVTKLVLDYPSLWQNCYYFVTNYILKLIISVYYISLVFLIEEETICFKMGKLFATGAA